MKIEVLICAKEAIKDHINHLEKALGVNAAWQITQPLVIALEAINRELLDLHYVRPADTESTHAT